MGPRHLLYVVSLTVIHVTIGLFPPNAPPVMFALPVYAAKFVKANVLPARCDVVVPEQSPAEIAMAMAVLNGDLLCHVRREIPARTGHALGSAKTNARVLR